MLKMLTLQAGSRVDDQDNIDSPICKQRLSVKRKNTFVQRKEREDICNLRSCIQNLVMERSFLCYGPPAASKFTSNSEASTDSLSYDTYSPALSNKCASEVSSYQAASNKSFIEDTASMHPNACYQKDFDTSTFSFDASSTPRSHNSLDLLDRSSKLFDYVRSRIIRLLKQIFEGRVHCCAGAADSSYMSAVDRCDNFMLIGPSACAEDECSSSIDGSSRTATPLSEISANVMNSRFVASYDNFLNRVMEGNVSPCADDGVISNAGEVNFRNGRDAMTPPLSVDEDSNLLNSMHTTVSHEEIEGSNINIEDPVNASTHFAGSDESSTEVPIVESLSVAFKRKLNTSSLPSSCASTSASGLSPLYAPQAKSAQLFSPCSMPISNSENLHFHERRLGGCHDLADFMDYIIVFFPWLGLTWRDKGWGVVDLPISSIGAHAPVLKKQLNFLRRKYDLQEGMNLLEWILQAEIASEVVIREDLDAENNRLYTFKDTLESVGYTGCHESETTDLLLGWEEGKQTSAVFEEVYGDVRNNKFNACLSPVPDVFESYINFDRNHLSWVATLRKGNFEVGRSFCIKEYGYALAKNLAEAYLLSEIAEQDLAAEMLPFVTVAKQRNFQGCAASGVLNLANKENVKDSMHRMSSMPSKSFSYLSGSNSDDLAFSSRMSRWREGEGSKSFSNDSSGGKPPLKHYRKLSKRSSSMMENSKKPPCQDRDRFSPLKYGKRMKKSNSFGISIGCEDGLTEGGSQGFREQITGDEAFMNEKGEENDFVGVPSELLAAERGVADTAFSNDQSFCTSVIDSVSSGADTKSVLSLQKFENCILSHGGKGIKKDEQISTSDLMDSGSLDILTDKPRQKCGGNRKKFLKKSYSAQFPLDKLESLKVVSSRKSRKRLRCNASFAMTEIHNNSNDGNASMCSLAAVESRPSSSEGMNLVDSGVGSFSSSVPDALNFSEVKMDVSSFSGYTVPSYHGCDNPPGGYKNLTPDSILELNFTPLNSRVMRLTQRAMQFPYVHGVMFEAGHFAWIAKIGSESRRFLAKKFGWEKSRWLAVERVLQWRRSLSDAQLEEELQDEGNVVSQLRSGLYFPGNFTASQCVPASSSRKLLSGAKKRRNSSFLRRNDSSDSAALNSNIAEGKDDFKDDCVLRVTSMATENTGENRYMFDSTPEVTEKEEIDSSTTECDGIISPSAAGSSESPSIICDEKPILPDLAVISEGASIDANTITEEKYKSDLPLLLDNNYLEDDESVLCY